MECLNKIIRKELLLNGVYKITNIKNKKFYIGSCSSKSFLYDRLIHHQQDLINNKHCNIYLQRSFNKYGIESFYYEIIEICLPENCIKQEQHWIDILKPHYNLCKKAGSSFGRKLSQETIDKISKANKLRFELNPNLRIEISKRNKGKKRSLDVILKTSKKNKGKKRSKEIKDKMSKAMRKDILNIDTGEIYKGLEDASDKLKVATSHLSMVISGKRKGGRKIKNALIWLR